MIRFEIRKNSDVDTLTAAGVVEEFLAQWQRSDLHDKMPKPQLIESRGLVELIAIGTYGKHQRKGYASRALRMLTDLADANGLTVELVARPLDDIPSFPGCPASLSTEELVAWYSRHGFVDASAPNDDTRRMLRYPKQGKGG